MSRIKDFSYRKVCEVDRLKESLRLLKILLQRSLVELKNFEEKNFKKIKSQEEEESDLQSIDDFYGFREEILKALFQWYPHFFDQDKLNPLDPSGNQERLGKESLERKKMNSEIVSLLEKKRNLIQSILIHDQKVLSLIEKKKFELLKEIHEAFSEKKHISSYKSLLRQKGCQTEFIK